MWFSYAGFYCSVGILMCYKKSLSVITIFKPRPEKKTSAELFITTMLL